MADSRGMRLKPYVLIMFAFLALGYFLIFIHRTTGGATSGIIQDHFGVNTASVTLLASSYLYAYIAMQIPAGLLTDKIGPRKCITIFLVLISLSSLLSSFAAEIGNFNLMVVSRVLIGVFAAFVVIPASKLIAVWVTKDRFATVDGVFMFFGNLGAIFAAAPMVILLKTIGIVNTYLVLTAVTLIIAIICWFIVRDSSGESVHRTDPTNRIGARETIKILLSDGRRFWFLAIWALLLYSVFMLWSNSQAGMFYNSVYGYSSTDAGILLSICSIGMAISCMLSGIFTDRVLKSTKKMLIICSFLSTMIWGVILFMTCFKSLDNFIVQGIINFSFGMSVGCSLVMFSQIRNLYPMEIMGASIAFLNFFPFLGGATLIGISGFIVPNKSLEEYVLLWSIGFILLVASLIISFFTVENDGSYSEDEVSAD